MILSRKKQNFVLDKVIEAIHNSYDYSMDNMSYSKTFNLKYESLKITFLFEYIYNKIK